MNDRHTVRVTTSYMLQTVMETESHSLYTALYCQLNFVQKIQISLKSDKNDRRPSWRPMYINDNVPYFNLQWEMFQKKL